MTTADGLRREAARKALVVIGRPAVVGLIQALRSSSRNVRWEAVKALGEIGSGRSAPALVSALEDENLGVRWAAADALPGLGRAAIEPLLHALMMRSDSIWLREGAHHVCTSLSHSGYGEILGPVLDALDDVQPVLGVPYAAYTALNQLRLK